MANQKTTKDKPSVSDFFDGDVDLAEFARGMARLPELGTMMRLAGLGDARRLAGVKMTSSRLDKIRAAAVGTKRARDRAARAEAHATQLAIKLYQEEETARPEVGILDQLSVLSGRFEVYGKVIDTRGQPVAGAKVEVAGKTTGVMFSATTGKDGVFRIGLPVGDKDTQADDGEDLLENVTLDGTFLQSGLLGVAKAGEMARRVLTVPLAQTVKDMAAPILFSSKTSDGSGGTLEAVRPQEVKRGTGTANPASGNTETPATTKGKSPSSAARASPAKTAATKPKAAKKATSRSASKSTVKGTKPKGK